MTDQTPAKQLALLEKTDLNGLEQRDRPLLAELHQEVATLVDWLEEAGDQGRWAEVQLLVSHIRQLQAVQRGIIRFTCQARNEAAAQPQNYPEPPLVPAYLAGSLFLRDCYRYLVQGKPEWMHAVTGTQSTHIRTLDRMILLEPAQQSIAGVTARPEAVFEALIELYQHGHALHAVFHSHRFAGIPRPSAVDWALQERLDRGGYPTIQCIFSEDGYLTWFAGQQPFRLQIFGKGMEQIDEYVWRFSHGSDAAYPAASTPA